MPLLQIDRHPSPRDLRVFAWGLPAFFGVLGGLRWWAGSPRAAVVIWVVGAAVATLALAVAPARRWLYLGWMYASYPVAWTVSHLLLIVVYALVATPTALLLRLLGRDPMRRRFDPHADSYWIERASKDDPARDPSRYFRQS